MRLLHALYSAYSAYQVSPPLPGRVPPLQRIVIRGTRALAEVSFSSYLIHEFVSGDHGTAYGITKRDRMALVEQFKRNTSGIESGTSWLYHIILARQILAIEPHVAGAVIECGVWKGASTASLSLACRLVGRRLLVCDSFEGLPEIEIKPHVIPHHGSYGYYKQGMFAGCLDEVRNNIRRFGALEVCDFIPGFFADSLPGLREPIVFAFLDVDLPSSTRDCLRYIWPLLVEGGFIYSDDAGDLEVAHVFFDQTWWQETLGCSSPGYIGAGCGLPLNPDYSSLGYTRKISQFTADQWRRVPYLHYPDEEPADHAHAVRFDHTTRTPI